MSIYTIKACYHYLLWDKNAALVGDKPAVAPAEYVQIVLEESHEDLLECFFSIVLPWFKAIIPRISNILSIFMSKVLNIAIFWDSFSNIAFLSELLSSSLGRLLFLGRVIITSGGIGLFRIEILSLICGKYYSKY